MKRKTFLKTGAAAATSMLIPGIASSIAKDFPGSPMPGGADKTVIISTWNFGAAVTETAYATLKSGGSLLDAVEKAINIVESDPKVTSVGIGGYPDRDGHVTLDACIMDEHGNAGSVLFLEHIEHPISVARAVMEKTPHVILTGDGALQFALEQGFKRGDFLTDDAKEALKKWLKETGYKQVTPSKDSHDTLGLLAMDAAGNIAGGCSTSGMAFKMHGRVGDSPILGAGLFVDNEVGAATSTGLGEAVIKTAGSAVIVEAMRHGKSPQDACKFALELIVRKQPKYKEVKDFLVGFVAINKAGEIGACSYRKGLQYSLTRDGKNKVYDAEYLVS